MNDLQMIECQLDPAALLRFLRGQGLDDPGRDPDFGYGVHAWLKAAFGDQAPRPWRRLADRKRPARVLAYGAAGADTLTGRMRDFADPTVLAVCPPEAIASKPLPAFHEGRVLDFELLGCPVGRKARSGIEKDLFLLHADREPDARLDRGQIYCDWARERLQVDHAATIERLALTGHRQVRQLRKHQGAPGERRIKRPTRPEALFHGRLQVRDPEGFQRLLARGIGRHRAFGYGMLLLRPPGD